jgi:hypothetical protein
MKRRYQVLSAKETQKIGEWLAKDGQLRLPMMELIEASRLAVEEVKRGVSPLRAAGFGCLRPVAPVEMTRSGPA